MAYSRLELACAPGHFVSGPRAMRLLDSGKARLDDCGKLQLLASAGSWEKYVDTRVRWTEYSAGYLMNGRAVNRA